MCDRLIKDIEEVCAPFKKEENKDEGEDLLVSQNLSRRVIECALKKLPGGERNKTLGEFMLVAD